MAGRKKELFGAISRTTCTYIDTVLSTDCAVVFVYPTIVINDIAKVLYVAVGSVFITGSGNAWPGESNFETFTKQFIRSLESSIVLPLSPSNLLRNQAPPSLYKPAIPPLRSALDSRVPLGFGCAPK